MPSIDLNDPIAVLLAATSAFERAKIQTAVYGGLALAAYGKARETKDADLAVAGVSASDAHNALRAVGLNALLAFDRMRFGGQFVSRFTLIGEGATNTVDLVEPRSAGYADRVIARAITGKLRGQQIQVVAPEDFVVMKILATRERDLEDADTVMWNVAATLDMDLINRELEFLAGEIADHEIAERWRRTKLDD